MVIHDEEFTGLLDRGRRSSVRLLGWVDGDADDARPIESLIAAYDDADLDAARSATPAS